MNLPKKFHSFIFESFLIMAILGCNSFPSTDSELNTISLPQVPTPIETWNVGFLIMNGVYNTELTAPMDIFQHTIFHHDKGMKVFTIADTKDPVHTFEGLKILPDYNYLTDSLPPIHVLVVPSAEHHLDTDLENEDMIAFVKDAGGQAQYVVSLCDGAFVLAKSGLLDGIASTTFPGDIEKYKKMFPHLKVHQDVLFVHDGKFITSAGGAKSFEPAMYLCELLYGEKAVKGIGKGMVIDWDLRNVRHVIIEED